MVFNFEAVIDFKLCHLYLCLIQNNDSSNHFLLGHG
jgi:hypothetical protein